MKSALYFSLTLLSLTAIPLNAMEPQSDDIYHFDGIRAPECEEHYITIAAGDVFRINKNAMLSAGEAWFITNLDNQMIALLDENYKAIRIPPPGMCGGDKGIQIFTLQALQSGKTSFCLMHAKRTKQEIYHIEITS